MVYHILFHALNNSVAREAYEAFAREGHKVFTSAEKADIGDTLDMLVLALPGTDTANRGKTIREKLDYDAVLDTLDGNINGIYELVKEVIPFMKDSKLKRIALLTDRDASIRESEEVTDYGYHMSQAAANMLMKLLFNTYRPEGFTFRCYAGGAREGGVSVAEYLLTDQSYIETDDYIHSDENRIVLRDSRLREVSW